MSYTIDQVYLMVGRDDKVATLNFHPESESFINYGIRLTLVFQYDKSEREQYEKRFLENIDEGNYGNLKVRYLGFDQLKEKIEILKKEGINSKDILSIYSSSSTNLNLYHKEAKRTINKLEIPIRKEAKGGDYDWMYGFKKRLVGKGFELFPHEKDFYLAMKLYYEPNSLTTEELVYAYDGKKLKESIERLHLDLKFEREIISPEEELRWEEITKKYMASNFEKIKQELQNVGSNIDKLYLENKGLYNHLTTGTYKYIPERLNGFDGKPIYLDWNGYLHVFMRHVEEFKINKAFENKDKFLWNPEDVLTVMKLVIENVDDEIQQFWKDKPSQRFSKYGAQSLYFEGDYYTFHVESDGKLSTFHRTKKKSD